MCLRPFPAELASEEEFEDLFPGSELGAMPPFGNLYDVPVYVDRTLGEDEEIAFSAGQPLAGPSHAVRGL